MKHRHTITEGYTPTVKLSDFGVLAEVPKVYQVWILGYSANDELLQEKHIRTFFDPDAAVKYAADIFSDVQEQISTVPLNQDIAYLTITVETVLPSDEEDTEENVDTIFEEKVFTK